MALVLWDMWTLKIFRPAIFESPWSKDYLKSAYEFGLSVQLIGEIKLILRKFGPISNQTGPLFPRNTMSVFPNLEK